MDVETLARIPPWDWPADADQVLLRALGDPSEDEAVRQEAAMLAGDLVVMSDEVAAGLLAVLDSPDEDEKLRGRAAIAFGPALEELDLQMDDDPEEPAVSEDVAARIRTALQRLHLDSEVPKHVRRMALEASIRGSEDWHPEAVREAYHSGDPDWERTAVFCMGYMPGFEDRIVEALESPRDDVRRQAITAAGNQGVREAWPHVLDILEFSEHDRSLLLAALEAAPYVGAEEAKEVLHDFVDDDDREIAAVAEDALGMAEAFMSDPEDEDPGVIPEDDSPMGPHGNGAGRPGAD